jgi:hypothetical protein
MLVVINTDCIGTFVVIIPIYHTIMMAPNGIDPITAYQIYKTYECFMVWRYYH